MAAGFNWGTSTYYSKGSVLVAATPLSFSCWYLPNDFNNDAILICIGQTGSDSNMFDLQVFAASSPTKSAAVETGQAAAYSDTTTAANSLVAGTWYHLCGTIINSTTRNIYLNGSAGTNFINAGTARVPNTLGTTYLGRSGGGNLTRGTIAWGGIWNLALDPTFDIPSLAAGRHPRRVRPGGLVSVFNLTGGAASGNDLVSATPWTETGSVNEAANPPIYF
jgi:hypothetical protein